MPLKLRSLDIPLKVLFTGYLCVVGLGLLMGFAQILLTHGMADGKFGLSVDDIVYSYYGNRDGTVLESKLNGSMQDKAPDAKRTEIIKWVRDGASEKEWEAHIQPIFQQHCVLCHNAATPMPDFTQFKNVKERAKMDTGASIAALTRVSHIHLFGISFIFMFIGLIFVLSEGVPVWLKASAIASPYVFLFVDIFSWWLTKMHPNFAWLTIIGGAGYSLGFAFMWTVSMWQMWIPARKTHKTTTLRRDPDKITVSNILIDKR